MRVNPTMSKFIALRHVRLAAQHASGDGLFCARFQVEGNEKYTFPAFRWGPVCRGQFGEVLSFLWPTVQTIIEWPRLPGQSRLSGFCCAHRLCVRSLCQHISRMRTFDNNSCAISITSPRSLFRPRTQHGRWGHREKSRRASTRWDCRGKSCLAGLSPLSGTPSERRDCVGKDCSRIIEISG